LEGKVKATSSYMEGGINIIHIPKLFFNFCLASFFKKVIDKLQLIL